MISRLIKHHLESIDLEASFLQATSRQTPPPQAPSSDLVPQTKDFEVAHMRATETVSSPAQRTQNIRTLSCHSCMFTFCTQLLVHFGFFQDSTPVSGHDYSQVILRSNEFWPRLSARTTHSGSERAMDLPIQIQFGLAQCCLPQRSEVVPTSMI